MKKDYDLLLFGLSKYKYRTKIYIKYNTLHACCIEISHKMFKYLSIQSKSNMVSSDTQSIHCNLIMILYE